MEIISEFKKRHSAVVQLKKKCTGRTRALINVNHLQTRKISGVDGQSKLRTFLDSGLDLPRFGGH